MTQQMPNGHATCPKCKGTTRIPAPAHSEGYKTVISGYDRETDTFACDNCGGQTMSLHAVGHTRIDPATGLGCLHEFTGRKAGNCYHVYTCSKCGTTYDIDSGD
jgi:predicted RNA-binding Zn-ribbon protein involved in translation (DUF1610 family)